jgi:hypothetical protein
VKTGRKPYPKERDPRKTVFTPTMWSRWLREQPWATKAPDNQTLRLREGITEFRRHLGIVTRPTEEIRHHD